jgi:hypothetical protein
LESDRHTFGFRCRVSRVGRLDHIKLSVVSLMHCEERRVAGPRKCQTLRSLKHFISESPFVRLMDSDWARRYPIPET